MINKIQQETFLREFFRAADPTESIGPDDPRYVRLYDGPSDGPGDPVKDLADTIEWSTGESAQLFSGFRGTGKSTELRRLERRLNDRADTVAFLCDMQQHMNLNTSVEISDFLISMAGAFGEEVEKRLGVEVVHESYYTRALSFLKDTNVTVTELGWDQGAVLKANLKQDPTVRRRVREHLAGHLGAFTRDVHEYCFSVVTRVQQATGKQKVVLILDSIEQVSGVNTQEVFASVVEMFRGQADKLRVPFVHVVYTVPPWLDYKAPGVARLYSGAYQLPCVRVRNKDGAPNEEGLALLREVVGKRGDYAALLGSDAAVLNELSLASGGYLRDLLRMVQNALRGARHTNLPITDGQRRRAIIDLANGLRKLNKRDLEVLSAVHAAKQAELEDELQIPSLSRLFDNNLLLNYRNGEEWLDAHPLVWDILPAPKPA
jgi:hypothetical protein